MGITKKELIEFIRDNCYVDNKLIHWNWKEVYGSQSSREINDKIKEFVLSEVGE